jgi:hypothetical protein
MVMRVMMMQIVDRRCEFHLFNIYNTAAKFLQAVRKRFCAKICFLRNGKQST